MAATLSRMMKKAASSIIPLANRTTHHRNYTSAISINSTTNLLKQVIPTTSFHAHRHFSALAEKKSNSVDTLLRDLESEMNDADEKFCKVFEESKEFPFKIDDKEWYGIILTGEYQGEEIEFTVRMPSRHEEKKGPPYVNLNISVSKEISEKTFAKMATTLTRMMKKASVIPNGYRTIPQRNYTTAISTSTRQVFQRTSIPTHRHFSALAESRSNTEIDREEENFQTTSIPTHHNFSALVEKRSNSDDTLLSVIESEIGCAEEKFRKFLETPREFPFKIVDIAKENRSVTLTREYQDEEIEVKVHNCYHIFANWKGSVSNKSGLTCEFTVTFTEDGLTIDKLNVKNPNEDRPCSKRPAFKDLDENSQKPLRTYLQVRGIEPSTMKTLYIECMTKYKHRKYMAWLHSIKDFITN